MTLHHLNVRSTVVTLALLAVLLHPTYADAAEEITVCAYTVAAETPHDQSAFTQGLTSHGERVFESTGLYGKSGVREIDPDNGKLLRQRRLDDDLFGEGLTFFNNKLYQITWKSGRGFVYDPNDLKVIDTFTYHGEGWGLTHDGEFLILSDGTSTLRFIDTDKYRVKRTIRVTHNDREVDSINELEYINGAIWANIWKTSLLAKISPDTGTVLAVINLAPLAEQFNRDGVANGIVWQEQTETFMVTGKNWPAMFTLVPDCL